MNALEERKKIIEEIIKPAFKKLGFKKTGNNFVKHEEKFIKVFTIENWSWNTKTNVNFDLVTGIHFPLIDKVMTRETPKNLTALGCHFHCNSINLNNVVRSFEIKPDIDITEFRSYISEVIKDFIIPFFDRHTKVEDLTDLIEINRSYWDIKPFVGLMLLENGNIKEGNKLMENVNPTYIESFKKQLIDCQSLLLSNHNKQTLG